MMNANLKQSLVQDQEYAANLGMVPGADIPGSGIGAPSLIQTQQLNMQFNSLNEGDDGNQNMVQTGTQTPVQDNQEGGKVLIQLVGIIGENANEEEDNNGEAWNGGDQTINKENQE